MLSPIEHYLHTLHGRLNGLTSGELASYIPELTKANPDWLGISIVTMDGVAYSVGDAEQLFTIQSISKPFVYGMALADRGQDGMAEKVGVEPSGDAFNSISLHPQTGAPLNPMINAGAIATTSLVAGRTTEAQWERIQSSIETFVGHPVPVDESVYHSESATGHRNRAIAWMLKNFGIIEGEPMASLENYFRQCAIQVSCRDLAYMAATLANGGVHPVTGRRALPAEHVGQVLSVMATCGMYDFAGSWLYEVGMPAKSGVGGGVIAVVPGRFGIAIFSPRLDAKGNSVRGIEACRHMSRDFGLHMFQLARDPRQALGRVYTGADASSRRKPVGPARQHLIDHAHRIKYLSLHGMLAVDGVEYVVRRMLGMAADTDCFILDMNQVSGLADSAARMLHEARRALAAEGKPVVCSRVHRRAAILQPLARTAGAQDRGFLVFEDNDLAVEWCENRLLQGMAAADDAVVPLAESPLLVGYSPDMLRLMDSHMSTEVFGAGDAILKAGEAGDGRVFFIESGRVSVLVPLDDGGHQRIASLGPGMEFGEMTLLGQTQRTASVVADSNVRCRVLHVSDLEALALETPQIKIRLLENLAKDLAVKLRGATQWIAALA
jgi:glutaminase